MNNQSVKIIVEIEAIDKKLSTISGIQDGASLSKMVARKLELLDNVMKIAKGDGINSREARAWLAEQHLTPGLRLAGHPAKSPTPSDEPVIDIPARAGCGIEFESETVKILRGLKNQGKFGVVK